MPDLKDNYFPLFGGQTFQEAHGGTLGRPFVGFALKPAAGLEFAS